MHRRILVLLVPALACASSKKKKDELLKVGLQESAQSYNEALRWGHLEKAVAFVAPEDRDRFLVAMQSVSKDVRVTEVRIGLVEVPASSTDDATVTVTRSFFRTNELTERSETLIQKWFRKQNHWFVRFDPPAK